MDKLAVIHSRLTSELDEMNRIIRESLQAPNPLMQTIVDGYLKVHGKQIRPIMVILSAGLFGNVNRDVMHAGAALEILHNASLIHDDVVDETPLRRGQPTVNATWGNHIAVLVGDFFVSNALMAGIKTGNIEIISALSDLGKELSLGEIDQICNARDRHFDELSYLSMIGKKTASLFVNCVRMGAEAAGATRSQYGPLLEFARLFGLAFQIKDDIFDYFENPQIGKPTGNDLREGKVTLPLIHALATADPGTAVKMKELLGKEELSIEEINTLIDFAKQNGGIEYAEKRMEEMRTEALAILDTYPQSQWRQSFADIFDYTIERRR